MKKLLFISIFFIFTFNSFAHEKSSEKSDSVNNSVENSAATSIENATETSDIIEATDEKTLEKTTQESPTNQEVVEQNENIETIQDEKTKSTEENLNEKPEVQEESKQELKSKEKSEQKVETETKSEETTEKPSEETISEDFLAENQEETESQEKKIEYKPLPFEGMDHPEVERFRQRFLSPKWTKLLHDCLENAMEYRLFVRQAIAEKEMPEILEYLPVVESNYKTSAKSKSGAIGMWQFMANSVYPFLTLNDYVDQRLDPWASTDAALKKLTDNYNYFGDWLIAIAAYNCGVGAMNRVLKKSEKKDFWYLVDKKLLPKQTAEYIPKLLAIADLAINAEYYQIDLPHHNEEFELLENEKNGHFDYISVSKAYSLTALANNLRMDTKTIKHLNPSYTMGFTHPSKESKIRLPLGMKSAAEEAIKQIEPIDFPIKYKVVSGDSLWSISRRYKTTVDAICELNNIKENAILKIGKILYIPSK